MTIAEAAVNAAAAFPALAALSATERSQLLHAAADVLDAATDDLVETAMAETHMADGRLRGEVGRMTGQLRYLGEAGIDVAADRVHSPEGAPDGSDITRVRVPIGPVAVFGASNFPFAFGIAGGDTASALAAGCPVVAKAHPAQPKTAQLIASLLRQGLDGAPDGTFSVVDGGPEASIELVTADPIRAVGFTGSNAGGRALMDAAAARPDPIAVYAEMGSINPVIVLPGGAANPDVAGILAAAVTGSSGQFCTKPGLILTPDGDLGSQLAGEVAAAQTHPLLTPSIEQGHAQWLERAQSLPGTTVVAGQGDQAQPFAVLAGGLDTEGVLDEHFGPSVVVLDGVTDYAAVLDRLPGTLTASVFANLDVDRDAVAAVLPTLVARAGRVILNGVPTGVGVVDAMQHGGPWPATSAPGSTSVGSASIDRFVRPVALQGFPDDLIAGIARA